MNDTIRASYLALLAGTAPDAKSLKEGQVRCTAEQWQTKSTLRTWWTRLLAAAGVQTTQKRGGPRVKMGKAKKGQGSHIPPTGGQSGPATTGESGSDKPPITTAPVPPITPRVINAHEAGLYYQREAAAMLRFTMANAEPVAGKPAPTEAFRKLVAKFAEDIAKLIKKLEK